MSIDCYIIPPNKHLELMHHGDRYFCLAQLYRTNKEYRDFFKTQKRFGKWITLDNGAGDHALITEDILFDCMIDLMPNEVIPPDTLFNKDVTLKALHSFVERMKAANLLDKIQIFACPQGEDKEAWLSCYSSMLKNPNVSTIGMSKLAIPHAFVGQTSTDQGIKEARNQAFALLKEKGLLQKPLHFLGMGDPTEFGVYKNEPMVRSTDSCNTVWSGANSIDFAAGNFTRIKTPHDYFDLSFTDEQLTMALSNITWFRNLLK